MLLTIIISAAALILGGIGGYLVFRYVLKGKYNEMVEAAKKEADVMKEKKLYIFTLANAFFFYEFFNYFVQFSYSFLSANKASMISIASVATNLSYSLLP